jgi:N-acetyl-gamma-glutamyl-phosphate reductase
MGGRTALVWYVPYSIIESALDCCDSQRETECFAHFVCTTFFFFLVGRPQKHKHIPEMAKYSGLGKTPIFQPAVASFPQGMVVSIPLHYAWLAPGTTGAKIHETLKKYYEDSVFIKVMPHGEADVKEAGLLERGAFLRPDTLANTNNMELFVFDNDDEEEPLLCARLDNLGKGASGAAVQNLNLALGLDETTGLL